MPILRPDGKGAPADWRWAQHAFDQLYRWGKAAGEPVQNWYLSFPSRGEKLTGKQWRLYYTERNKTYDVYVGWDGRSVAETIGFIINTMKLLAKNRSTHLATEIVIHDERIAAGQARDPIFEESFARKAYQAWLRGTANITTRDELDRFKRDHRRLMEILGRRAGVFDMSFLQYLTKHPDAKIWPNPPANMEEYYIRHPDKRPRKDSNA